MRAPPAPRCRGVAARRLRRLRRAGDGACRGRHHDAGGRPRAQGRGRPRTSPACWRPTPTRTSTSPRPTTSSALRDAALVVRSGGDLDEWLDGGDRRSGTDAPVLTLADHVDALDGDPHWWQDPRNAIAAIAALRDGARARPTRTGAPRTRRNAAATPAAASARPPRRRCIGEVPPAQRKLVTTHDALGAYARRYGLEVVGAVIPSRSTRGAGVGGRDRGARRDDPARGRAARSSPRARSTPTSRRRSRARRARGSAPRCGPTRSGRRARRRDVRRLDRRQHAPRSSTASSGGAGRLPAA